MGKQRKRPEGWKGRLQALIDANNECRSTRGKLAGHKTRDERTSSWQKCRHRCEGAIRLAIYARVPAANTAFTHTLQILREVGEQIGYAGTGRSAALHRGRGW